MQYRADIDGLRAIAVLSVVSYHAGSSVFSGGYMGVDIFFVISGYLITSIIYTKIQAGSFSIVEFYEKRVRRLLPALMFVLATLLPFAIWLLFPSNLKDFGQALVSTNFFASNFLFWFESGYFDEEAHLKPLLHTWSLAVEEQFYIFFPPMLMALYAISQKLIKPIIALLFILSLSAGYLWLDIDASGAFYLLPFRAWELMIGAMIALGMLKLPDTKYVREVCSAAGLVLILYAVFELDDQIAFPGFYALIPCLGTALIIMAGAGSACNKVLSFKVMTFIGLISYSLYLWHWPIIVLAKTYAFRDLLPLEMAGCIVLSIFLAWFSWKFVETPFRQKREEGWRRSMIFMWAALATLVFSGIGVGLHIKNGLPERFETLQESANEFRHYRVGTCFLKNQEAKDFDATQCSFGADKATTDYIIWGDSHAAHWYPGLAQFADKQNLRLIQATYAGCRPVIAGDLKQNKQCAVFNEHVLSEAISKFIPKKGIVIGLNWAKALDEKGFIEDFERTLKFLAARDIPVILLGPTPIFKSKVPLIVYQMNKRGLDVQDIGAFTDFFTHQEKFDYLEKLSGTPNVTLIYPHKDICPNKRCLLKTENGELLYWDRSHITKAGSIAYRYIFDDLTKD